MFLDYIEIYIRDGCPDIEERDVIVKAVDSMLTTEYKKAILELKEDIKTTKGISPELEPEEFQMVYSVKVMEVHKACVNKIAELVASFIVEEESESEDEI